MLVVFDELMYLATGKYWNVSHIWCICLLESTEMHLVIFLVKMLLVIDIILYSKVLKMLPYFDKIPIAKYWNAYDDVKKNA